MKAAVYHGPKNIKVEDVPEPKAAGRRVLVEFKAGSICGTDLHLYRGDWSIRRGRIIGHDACGVRVDTGERVVMMPLTYCGRCFFCLRGLPTFCERDGEFMGLDRNGFFAETVSIRKRNLIPVPDSLSDEEAGIVEPVALALHVLDQLEPRAGDWAVIVGQGPIGLLMSQVAKLKGCKVIAVDLESQRLGLAEKYGANVCINPREDDVIKRVKEITKRGADVVIESAGSTKTVEQTPYLVRKAGKVALIGEFQGNMDFGEAYGAVFFTSFISPVEYPTAVELMAEGKLDVKTMITHRFRLANFEKAIQTAADPAQKPLKVVVTA
ncbi:MAG: zinc-binding dehydrogenase [Candidatus Bathyarchaeia archaeon]